MSEYQINTRLPQHRLQKIKEEVSPDSYVGLWIQTTILKKDYIVCSEGHIYQELIRHGWRANTSVTLMYAARVSIRSVLDRLVKEKVIKIARYQYGTTFYKRGTKILAFGTGKL